MRSFGQCDTCSTVRNLSESWSCKLQPRLRLHMPAIREESRGAVPGPHMQYWSMPTASRCTSLLRDKLVHAEVLPASASITAVAFLLQQPIMQPTRPSSATCHDSSRGQYKLQLQTNDELYWVNVKPKKRQQNLCHLLMSFPVDYLSDSSLHPARLSVPR